MKWKILRVISGMLLPTPIAIIVFLAYGSVDSSNNEYFTDTNTIKLHEFIAIVYLVTGIQSIIYSFAMEFLVNRIKEHFVVIAISTLIGAFFTFPFWNSNGSVLSGMCAGFVLGILLRFIYVETSIREPGVSGLDP